MIKGLIHRLFFCSKGKHETRLIIQTSDIEEEGLIYKRNVRITMLCIYCQKQLSQNYSTLRKKEQP